MSQTKKDQVFPVKLQAISDEDLAEIVGFALRKDFGESTSAIKNIGRLTNTNPRAVKNWFQGKNAPSSGHLLLLAKSSSTILKFILMQIGGEDLWDAFRLLSRHGSAPDVELEPTVYTDTRGSKDVTTNVTIKSLSERQRWFLVTLNHTKTVDAEMISNHFGVFVRTARRDIDELKIKGAIEFTGSNKTGNYRLSGICVTNYPDLAPLIEQRLKRPLVIHNVRDLFRSRYSEPSTPRFPLLS